MTKEELEREARINLKRRFGEFFPQLTISYVMGAEPREKRITELEKQLAISEHDREHNDYELTEVYKKIADLEKENAELSEQLLVVSEQLRLAKEMPYSAVKKFAEEKTQDQLSKAKEIIKKLYSHVFQGMGFMELNDFNVQKAEVEQFLKEIKENDRRRRTSRRISKR